MAHECPDCGECCYCNGDIDDCCHNFDEDIERCTHCVCKDCGDTMPFCNCFEPFEFDDDE